MIGPSTPKQTPTTVSRKSQTASQARAMHQWLTNPGPDTYTPTTTTGQLLPQASLRSCLEVSLRDLSPPKTLATSIKSQPPDTESLAANSDDTLTEVEGALIVRSKSPIDLDPPYPTPLHVIEAIVGATSLESKKKLAGHSWELSDLDAQCDQEIETIQYREALYASSDSSGASVRQELIAKSLDRSSAPAPVETKTVRSWLGDEASEQGDGPRVSDDVLRDTNACLCDIDTFTGGLLPAILYPDTHKRIEGECNSEKDIGWRQENMTSTLQISREINARKRIAEQARANLRAKEEAEAKPIPQEDAWPKAKCLIRPALPKDFIDIANIINLETQKPCPRILQTAPANPEQISYIYNYCRANFRPFIVAEAGENELLDRSKWPHNAGEEYEAYLKYKQVQPKKPTGILGFAFVTESRVGFLVGTHCPGSQYSGQIRLLVHPEHRHKLYGSALLDRILSSTAIYHRSLLDYKWEAPGNDTFIYNTLAATNRRKYTRLYLETAVGKADPDNEWIANWLTKFEFRNAACFEQALKTDRGHKSEWLDLIVWELEARPVNEIEE